MNRIFKVIWSKTKNCYIVASEMAKSHTKAPSCKGLSRTLVCGVLACILGFGITMPVVNAYFTQYPGDISVINIDDQYFNPDADNNTALEWDLGRSDSGNIEYSIGVHSYALKIGNVLTGEAGLADATDVYDSMHVSNGNFINANNSVAQNLTALDNAIAGISGSGSLGNNSSAYLSDGYFALGDANGVYFADVSGDLNDALNELYYASEFEEGDQYSGLIENNSIGFKALKDKNGNVIFKGGIKYQSFGNLPDAMKTVTLSGEKAVEYGIVTQAELNALKARDYIDFAAEGGYASQAVGYGSTALGLGANALGDGNIAIGNSAGAVLGKTVGGTNNGFNYVITEPDQMAASDAVNNISIGRDSFANGDNGIAIGTRSWAESDDSIAVGRGAVGNAGGIAVGKNSYSVKSGNIALGDGALADSGNFSMLLSGDDQPIHGNVALGADSVAPDDDNNVVSIGAAVGDKVVSEISGNVKTITANEAFTRRIINVSDGIDLTDAVTVRQLNEAIAGAGGTSYTAGNHISIGNDNSIAAVIDGMVSFGNTGLVNGGQVYDAIQTIRPNVYIAGNGIVINGDDNSVSVKNVIMYDSDSQDTATLNGTRGTKLTNLKVGSLANGSTDAVVGHQLWQTNENIRGFAQDIQTNSTNITNLTTSVTNALSSVSAISTTVDAINNVKADASLNNLTDTGRQVIASAAANAVQEYMASNGGNGGSTGSGLLGGSNSTLSASIPRAMGFGLMANLMNNDNDDIVTNNDDLNGNGDNTISQAVQDALDTKVEISDFNTALDLKADKDSVYSKDEVDIKFDTKADISYVDNQLGSKADLSYVDAEFEKKADKDSVYTKDEADSLLDAKADKAMLDEKADKNASNIEVEDWAKVLGIGEIAEGNTNLVNGGTVYSALQNVKGNDLMAVDNNAIRIGGNAKYDDVRTIDVSTASGEGRVITGVVVNPEDATSVANVGYVNAIGENIIAGVTESFRRVDDKISDVGANAAAMSALMPAGDDADKKCSLSAAVGHYDSSTAGAVGLFYKPSDNVILNVRGTVGSDENMLAGGVSVALDKGSTPGISKAQMVKTINAQAEKIVEQDQKLLQQDERMQQQEQEIAQLKAVVNELVKGQNKK